MSLDQLKVFFTRVQGHTDLFQSVVTTTTANNVVQITASFATTSWTTSYLLSISDQ